MSHVISQNEDTYEDSYISPCLEQFYCLKKTRHTEVRKINANFCVRQLKLFLTWQLLLRHQSGSAGRDEEHSKFCGFFGEVITHAHTKHTHTTHTKKKQTKKSHKEIKRKKRF